MVVAPEIFVYVRLSVEFCHRKVADPQPVAGERLNTTDPLWQRDARDELIDASGGNVVTVAWAVLIQLLAKFVAVQV